MNFCASKKKKIVIVFVFITSFFSCDVFPADESCFRRCTDVAKTVVRPFAGGLAVSFLSLAGSGDPIAAAGFGCCAMASLALWGMRDQSASRQAERVVVQMVDVLNIGPRDIPLHTIPLGGGGRVRRGRSDLSCRPPSFGQR